MLTGPFVHRTLCATVAGQKLHAYNYKKCMDFKGDAMKLDEMAAWIRPLSAGGGPRYLQIVDLIAAGIDRGLLRPGDRLPPQRTLAQLLDVDLTTVTRAYAEARHRKLLDAVTGRGSFIPAQTAEAGPSIDLSMNIPPPPRGLRLGDLMERGLAEVLSRSNVDQLMTYQVGAGSRADRSAASKWLEPLLGHVEPERIVISAGAQAAIAALLSTLTRPGDAVAADPLTYPGFLSAALQLGLKAVPAETDDEGIRPDALAACIRKHNPRLIYLTPTMQNPTTITMPARRRRDIAKIAQTHNLPIIEDDPYSMLAGDAPSPLATTLPQQTYYIATLSKSLTPGLRTAFVVVPDPAHMDPLLSALRTFTLMPAPLMVSLVTNWIRDGSAVDLLNAVRDEAAIRQRLAKSILPASARAHPNGLHIWQPLPAHWDRHRLVQAARQEGLGVTAADAFALAAAPDAVRISIGGVGERTRLAEALKTLADIMNDQKIVRRTDIV